MIRTGKYFKQFLLLSILIPTINICWAQHSTSSPYSAFGLGEMDYRTYSKNSGMAGTGIGLNTPNFLNPNNPAGISIDSLMFLFDISSSLRHSEYYDNKTTVRANNANLRKIAVGFRVNSKLNVHLGITPFSTVKYQLTVPSGIEGTNSSYDATVEGSGGLSRVFMANSYQLNRNFSVGLKSSYIFGTINKTEYSTSQSAENNFVMDKFLFEFGAQYKQTVNDKLAYSLGATYGYKYKMNVKNKLRLSMANEDLTRRPETFEMPQYFGFGASATKIIGHSLWVAAADYSLHLWDGINSNATNVKFKNSHRWSAGLQVTPNYRTPRNYLQQMSYQAGLFYNKSHLQIYGTQLQEVGMSVGVNFPLRNRTSTIFLTADVGWQGGKKLIDERYFMITGGVALSEIWFMKWVYD